MASKVAEWQNARRGQRYPTRFMGTLMHDRRPLPITIADISRVGARLKGRDLPEIGDEVVLTATGLEVVATIVWNDGDACGINFHRTIEPLHVVRHNPFSPDTNALRFANVMRV